MPAATVFSRVVSSHVRIRSRLSCPMNSPLHRHESATLHSYHRVFSLCSRSRLPGRLALHHVLECAATYAACRAAVSWHAAFSKRLGRVTRTGATLSSYRRGIAALLLCLLSPASASVTSLASPDLVFEESGGLVAVEAEHFVKQEL